MLVYDTYRVPGPVQVGGTSASTPIITGIYALAGAPVKNTYPAEYMYLKSSRLFDVTSGANGTCGAMTYLCHGITGYDGPTGLGTPNGTGAFSIRAVTRVTLVDPGKQTGGINRSFSLKITGLDSRKVSSLHYSATGLPSGLSRSSRSRTRRTRRSAGPCRPRPGMFNVTVTAKDGSATGTTHFALDGVVARTAHAKAGAAARSAAASAFCMHAAAVTAARSCPPVRRALA